MKALTLEKLTREELIQLVRYVEKFDEYNVLRGLHHLQDQRLAVLLDEIKKAEEEYTKAAEHYLELMRELPSHPDKRSTYTLAINKARTQAENADKKVEQLFKKLEETKE